jgi:hypothetical protein
MIALTYCPPNVFVILSTSSRRTCSHSELFSPTEEHSPREEGSADVSIEGENARRAGEGPSQISEI